MVAIKDYEREGLLSRYFFTEFSSLQVVLLSNIFQNWRLCLEKSKSLASRLTLLYIFCVCTQFCLSDIAYTLPVIPQTL